MKTLIIGEIDNEARELLAKKTNVRQMSNDAFIKSDRLDCEALVIRTFTRIGEKEICKMPDLKYIVSCSVGLDNIDIDELKRRNIELIFCQGTNANSVAEHTIYLILKLIREDVKKPFFELKDKTIGLIGFGNIGKIVAEKLTGFGVKIIASDVIKQEKEVLERLKVKMLDIEDIAKNSDIVSIHVPFNKYTDKLINEKIFSEMKESCFLVNTSRAEVIDEKALIKFSKIKKFRGIALDVYSEKLKKELNFGNIILTNHLAAQGEDSFKKMCLEPIQKFISQV